MERAEVVDLHLRPEHVDVEFGEAARVGVTGRCDEHVARSRGAYEPLDRGVEHVAVGDVGRLGAHPVVTEVARRVVEPIAPAGDKGDRGRAPAQKVVGAGQADSFRAAGDDRMRALYGRHGQSLSRYGRPLTVKRVP